MQAEIEGSARRTWLPSTGPARGGRSTARSRRWMAASCGSLLCQLASTPGLGGRRRRRRAHFVLLVVSAVATMLAVPGIAMGQEDTTPPTLHALSCSPSSVDVTNGPQTITCTATITDDLSGVAAEAGDIALESPSHIQDAFSGFEHTSGDQYTAELTIPRYAEAGTWRPASFLALYLTDQDGNSIFLDNSELVALGITVEVMVTDLTPDTAPPTLTALAVSPSAVDVTDAPQTVTVTATITDDLSGIPTDGGDITFESPSGNDAAFGFFERTSGDEFTASVTIPQSAESGLWRPAGFEAIYLADEVGNFVLLDESDLLSMGFNVAVAVRTRQAAVQTGSSTPTRTTAIRDTSGPRMAIASKLLKVGSEGIVRIPLSCPSSEPGGCAGTLSLETLGRVRVTASSSRKRTRQRKVKLGSSSFRVAGGRTTAVKVRLSRKNRRLVKKLRRVRVRAIVRARDKAGNSATTKKNLTLRASAKRGRRAVSEARR